jgi:hypothetical protein
MQLMQKKEEQEGQKQYEYRKVQPILGGISLSIVLPKLYATNIGLQKGEFVKVSQYGNKIIVEKV